MCRVYEYYYTCYHSFAVLHSCCLGAFPTASSRNTPKPRKACLRSPTLYIPFSTECGDCIRLANDNTREQQRQLLLSGLDNSRRRLVAMGSLDPDAMAEFHRLNNWSTRLTNFDSETNDIRRQAQDLEKWPSKVGLRYPHRTSVPKKRERGSLLRYHEEAKADVSDVEMEIGEGHEQAQTEADIGNVDMKDDEGDWEDVSDEGEQVMGGEKVRVRVRL
ncbi:hypothetical protein EJ03DRAFT_382954 [Teratosphaeria nubilosa]|uniref:Uncharacterized protein n=1 Tax=Teratosphaeria nubilosa TaxID=161662 RepID=A0A6G1L998_9PEZI|nr:hypothetical protein EJ03DRAFT_382954 [Teratosphaeria nubilosa]